MSDQDTPISEKDVQDLMRSWAGSEQGRIIMSWFAHHYGYQSISTHQPGGSAVDLAFREGQRSVYAGWMNFIYGPDVRETVNDQSNYLTEEFEDERIRRYSDAVRDDGSINPDDGSGDPIF